MDKYIVPMPDIPKGITPIPSMNVDQPVVRDMVDLRPVGGLLEKIGYASIQEGIVDDPFESILFTQSGEFLLATQVESFARLANDYLITNDGDTRLHTTSGDIQDISMMSGKYLGYNGAVVMLDYPCAGAFMVHKPSVIPPESWVTDPGIGSVDWSKAYPQGGLILTLDGATSVNGIQPHNTTFLVFGDTKVAIFGLGQAFGQYVLPTPGVLSKWSWCGDFSRAFFIGQDKNLWAISQGAAQNIGFSWLWSKYTRAWMTYIPETSDIIILLDEGTDEKEYVNPACYLYNKGLTRLSINIVTAKYFNDEINALTTNGDLITITKPLREEGKAWNWETTKYDETTFQKPYDILTEWSDFGAASLKDLSGLEVKSLPFQPIYTRVNAFAVADVLPSTDDNWIKAPRPVAEHEKQGNRFQMEYRLPEYNDSGAAKYTAFRAHVKGADLWGLYGVTATQTASR